MNNTKKIILIVEDEINHFTLMERAFEPYCDFFSIIRAESLQSAKHILANNTVDLILLDLKLPDGYGLDLLKQDDFTINAPFIIMTGYGSQELVVEVLKCGALDYLVKNSDTIAELPHTVERALSKWELIEKDKKTSRELRESEKKYRSLVDNLPVGIFRSTIEGNIIHSNKALAEILEFENEEHLHGKSIREFYVDGDNTVDFYSRFDNSKAFTSEEKWITSKNKNIWVKSTCNLIETDNGIEYIDGIIENITAHKATEAVLVISELKYRRVFENIIDVYFETRIDGEILEISPSITAISNKDRLEYIGTSLIELFHDSSEGNNYIDLLLQKGKLSDYEAKLNIDDGKESADYSISSAIITDDFNGFLKIVGSIRDISERKHNETFQNTMFQIANAANISRNTTELFERISELLNNIIFTNNLFISLIDSKDNRITYPFFKNIDSVNQDMPAIHSLTEYILKTGNPILWNSKLINKKINEQKIQKFLNPPSEILAVPLKNSKECIGVICMMNFRGFDSFSENDLNIILFASNQIALSIERKLKEEQFQKLNIQLEQKVIERTAELKNAYNELKRENVRRKEAASELEKAKLELEIALENEKVLSEIKTRFISMISHEYRTPLTVVLSSTELVRMSIDNGNLDKVDKYLDKIENSVNTMNKLLENVLHIGKEQENLTNVNKSELDIIKIADTLIEEINNQNNNSFVIIKDYSFTSYILNTDPSILKAILTNILNNALKYSPEMSEIEFSINCDNNHILISISDQGIGIAEDEINSVFDPFFRCRNVGSIAGTGLGLTIAKKFVNSLNGKIFVKSHIGVGSTFIVELPIK